MADFLYMDDNPWRLRIKKIKIMAWLGSLIPCSLFGPTTSVIGDVHSSRILSYKEHLFTSLPRTSTLLVKPTNQELSFTLERAETRGEITSKFVNGKVWPRECYFNRPWFRHCGCNGGIGLWSLIFVRTK